jgi:hypothetical protein
MIARKAYLEMPVPYIQYIKNIGLLKFICTEEQIFVLKIASIFGKTFEF